MENVNVGSRVIIKSLAGIKEVNDISPNKYGYVVDKQNTFTLKDESGQYSIEDVVKVFNEPLLTLTFSAGHCVFFEEPEELFEIFGNELKEKYSYISVRELVRMKNLILVDEKTKFEYKTVLAYT